MMSAGAAAAKNTKSAMADNDDILASLLGGVTPEEEKAPEEAIPEAVSEDASPNLNDEAAATESTATTEFNQEIEQEIAATEAQNALQPPPSEGLDTPVPPSPSGFAVVVRDFAKKKTELTQLLKTLELTALRPEDIERGEALLLSRLDEYRALVLAQELWRMGLVPELRPQSADTEMETQVVVSQGAPIVALLPGASEVWISTLSSLPNAQIESSLGLVSCHRSIPRRFFRETQAQDMLGADLAKLKIPKNLPENQYEQLLQELTRELQIQALSKGANAVVAVELEFFPEIVGIERSHDEIRVLLTGTALRLTQAVDLPLNSL